MPKKEKLFEIETVVGIAAKPESWKPAIQKQKTIIELVDNFIRVILYKVFSRWIRDDEN